MTIQYSKQAEKFLKRQDATTRERIRTAIHNLPAGDVKKLQGTSGYRLRVGSYRVIFDRDGNVIYVERINNRGQIYGRYKMTAVKEKIIGAVTVMNDRDAQEFWDIIVKKYSPSWDDIEEVIPDETDLQMLDAIRNDPECHVFTKEEDIDWDAIMPQ